MDGSDVALGLIPMGSEAEFNTEFSRRFKCDCELRRTTDGKWLGVYGRRRWPSGQRRLMNAYIQGYSSRHQKIARDMKI